MGIVSNIFIVILNSIPYFFGFLAIAIAVWVFLYSLIEFIHDTYLGLSVWYLDLIWLIVKIIFAIITFCFGMTLIGY